jgi:hypothetical protein
MRLSPLAIAQQMTHLMDDGGNVEPRVRVPESLSFASSRFSTRALPFPSDDLQPWMMRVKRGLSRWRDAQVLGLGAVWGHLRRPAVAAMEQLDSWGWNRTQTRQLALTQALYEAWAKEGYLPQAPRAQLTPSSTALGAMAVRTAGMGLDQASPPHTVVMNIRPHGQVVTVVHEPMAADDSTHVDPNRGITTPVFRLWLMLGHEAGHTLFEGETQPFRPSATSLTSLGLAMFNPALHPNLTAEQRTQKVTQGLAHINRHVLGPGAYGPFATQLEEAFCDVFGIMLLLRTTNFHPQAQAEVHLHRAVRAANTAYHRQVHGDWQSESGIYLYDTATAVDLALARQDQWAALPPQALRQQALTITSEAWLLRAHEAMNTSSTLRSHLEALPLDPDRWPSTVYGLCAALEQGVSRSQALWQQGLPALQATPGHQAWGQVLAALTAPGAAQQSGWVGEIWKAVSRHPASATLAQADRLNLKLAQQLQNPMRAYALNNQPALETGWRTAMKDVLRWSHILVPALQADMSHLPSPPVQDSLPSPSAPRRRRRP